MSFPIRTFIFHTCGHLYLKLKLYRRIGFSKMNNLKKIKVCAFPENPVFHRFPLVSNGYSIEKILYLCDFKNTSYSPWLSYNLIINWQDTTVNEINIFDYIDKSHEHSGRDLINTWFLNQELKDISKKKVAIINKDVFGYDLDVDPLKYTGKVVKKSDLNGLHDGVIIECPIAFSDYDKNYVYNVCVNNVNNKNEAVDYRVIYMNGIIDIFYEKTRPLNSRFNTHKSTSKIRKTKSEFSDEEISNMTSFCKQIGADYGEMDVLRDRTTGKLYIVDFAKTPFGPLYGFTTKDRLKAIEEITVAFINNIFKKLESNQSNDKT